MNVFTNGRLVEANHAVMNENVSLDEKFRRGDFEVNNRYLQPNQLIGSPNFIKNENLLLEPKPIYGAESWRDCRTPLQKCEVKSPDPYVYKVPSIENDIIAPLLKKKDPFPYMKDL